MKNTQKAVISAEEALEKIMSIIEGPVIPAAQKDKPIKKVGPTITYEGNRAVEIDGKKVAVGPKKRGGKRTAKNDEGREYLKDMAKQAMETTAPYDKDLFEHSAEGLVIRLADADYTIKVTKSKENKFDTTEKDFKPEKDFSVRGKTKNCAPGIAKALIAALDSPDFGCKYTLCQAKASGVIIQIKEGEYTLKISKKRDRVGFEAEKAAAYANKK